MTPEFVAEARRVYVPAVRWMRAEGWNFGNMLSPDGLTTIHFDEVTDSTGHTHLKVIVHSHMTGLDETCHPVTFAQAVDYLVTAGVLPAEFHSIHASYVPADDYDGERVMLAPMDNGDVVQFWCDDTDGPPPEHYQPLFRRVTETTGSVTT